MNELLSDGKTLLLGLIGAMMALLTWLGKRQVRRIDDLERHSVTREELSKTLTQMREDRLQMHRENREELRYIRERVDGIADRQHD
jgi:cytochrome oxidase assembly protein ShyY1